MSSHTDSVYSLVKLNDSFILSGSIDSTMKIWSTKDWSVKKTINTPYAIRTLLLLNYDKIAVANDDDDGDNQHGSLPDYRIRIYE